MSEKVADQVANEDYELTVAAAMPLCYQDEEDYVVGLTGRIGYAPDGSREVGRIQGCLIQEDRAVDEGESLWAACDAHGDATAQAFLALFSRQTGRLRRRVARIFEDVDLRSNLLLLDSVEIVAEHRGHGVGLAAVQRVIDLFAAGCGLVVLKACPTQPDPGRRLGDPGWQLRMAGENFNVAPGRARRKLAAYWGRLGFLQVPDSDYCILSPAIRRPAASEVLLKL